MSVVFMSFKLGCLELERIAGMRLFCRLSSMMDKQMDMAVYLNARGMMPFMHDAMDASNNLEDTLMECSAWAA